MILLLKVLDRYDDQGDGMVLQDLGEVVAIPEQEQYEVFRDYEDILRKIKKEAS